MRRTNSHVTARWQLPVMLFNYAVCFEFLVNGPARAAAVGRCVTGALARTPVVFFGSTELPLAAHILSALVAACVIAHSGCLCLQRTCQHCQEPFAPDASSKTILLAIACGVAMVISDRLVPAQWHVACAGWIRHLPRVGWIARQMVESPLLSVKKLLTLRDGGVIKFVASVPPASCDTVIPRAVGCAGYNNILSDLWRPNDRKPFSRLAKFLRNRQSAAWYVARRQVRNSARRFYQWVPHCRAIAPS